MTRIPTLAYFTLTALAASGIVLAQDQPQQGPTPDTQVTQSAPAPGQDNGTANHGWRRADDPAPADAAAAPAPEPAPAAEPQQQYPGQPAPPPSYGNSQAAPPPGSGSYPGAGYPAPPTYGQNPGAYGQYPGSAYPGPRPNPNYQPRPQTPPPPIPSSLTLAKGTYVTVRVNQVLSSDHNHPGDAFTATLVRPIVINGVVIASHGQTIGGRVADAKKAGMVEGVSKLGLQLTDLTLVDGQNVPINSQLISREGPTSVGRDAGAIGTTTAVGAAAGAAADWGRGAAIGAGAGAAAGIIGVLLTRGRPTIIHPEETLTFRVEAPVTISTTNAPQAFRYVQPSDYQQAELRRGPPTMGVAGAPAPYPYPYPYYGPAYYGPRYYYGYPYYWGPSIGFYYGRGWGWRR